MNIKNVTIAGAGTLGSQIAWQTAFKGFNVTVYDAFETGLERGKQFHQQFANLFLNTRGASQEDIDQTFARLNYTTNLAEAVKDADLISESIPENLEIKKTFYIELAKVAPKKTIFTTNSSTLLPSQYAEETGRPEKFLALHFANWIWDANIGEVMGHPKTESKYFDVVIAFAKDIGMVPVPIYKEQHGYVINSLLGPLLQAAGNLLVNKVSDFETIDKTWMITSGAKMGPCAIMDMVGLETVYNIEKLWSEKLNDKLGLARAEYFRKNFIDKGKLGMKTGEGFYTYPNPKYKDPDFLS
ncbi:MAG: 3-hydroxyacyl-CoA dehydrogenase [Flavobacteriaceae bacterium]|nr:3-hydroxyacyl-CoA dehydrogenase [Flavobacteriaceae bacterium]